MPLQFHPAIARSTAWFSLPRPIVSLRVQDVWDSERFKSPLIDGQRTVGHSQGGSTIVIQGQVAAQAGEVRFTEAEMLATLLSLREALHVGESQPKFDFVLFFDPVTHERQYFQECSTTRLEWDLSEASLYTYSLTIQADDPQIHTA
ncbi:hypothetical protein Plim_3560 [Planctopirus limnophila DSM 3776]|uniref:Uncharacterized protein n=1 Tax=Planctopirus limnophila (strain ATCC 43296 / DSM 3776 / IFAM 1008 / Mu 290) TaxID=521674 RepID=D5SVL3_PLAL2|nr:hypothetical protein [Planctopirus limnophila]ADG69373.1 hypothetical protein Plim_3560 [Planctopirus limnophila DSM 3776]